MKKTTKILGILSLVIVTFTACTNSSQVATTKTKNAVEKLNQDEVNEVKSIVTAYKNALVAFNTYDISKIYTSNSVLMPNSGQTIIGKNNIIKFYEELFKTVKLDLDFFIDEIIIDGNYAFVRSTSKGTALIQANNLSVPEENRELFVFEKVDNQWKILRYIFNKTEKIVSATNTKITIGGQNLLNPGKENAGKLISSYEKALADSSINEIMSLYSENSVMLPSAFPTATGKSEINGTYNAIFSSLKYNLKFTIDEIVLGNQYGFIRTTSKGTGTLKDSMTSFPDENRELFIIKNINGQWKILNYMFNKIK